MTSICGFFREQNYFLFQWRRILKGFQMFSFLNYLWIHVVKIFYDLCCHANLNQLLHVFSLENKILTWNVEFCMTYESATWLSCRRSIKKVRRLTSQMLHSMRRFSYDPCGGWLFWNLFIPHICLEGGQLAPYTLWSFYKHSASINLLETESGL